MTSMLLALLLLLPAAAPPDPLADPPAEGGAAAAVPLRPAADVHLDAAELALWRDPAFQRYFVESYASETEIEPRVTESERKDMLKVLELISGDKMDEAAAMLEKKRGPASSAVLDFTLANIAFQQEHLDRAAELYRVAVDKYPKFRRAWKNLGLIRVRQGDYAAALPALTRVLELGGGDAITYGLVGFSYSNEGNDISAESAYRMAILLDPVTPDWKMGLARSFFKQKRYADAVALCDGLLADDPSRIDLWLLQANAYIGLEQPMAAAENYELVDRLGGSTAASLNTLGDIYINQELYDLAVASYVGALELDKTGDAQRPIRAAKVLTARGAYDESRRLIARIEATRGDKLQVEARKDLLKMRARLAVAEGSGDEEASVLEQIVELDPLDGEALILLGQHAGRAGDPAKAAFWYQRAEGIEGFEADAKVRHAQLLVQQGKYADALPLLRRAQALDPRDNVQQYLDQVERLVQKR